MKKGMSIIIILSLICSSISYVAADVNVEAASVKSEINEEISIPIQSSLTEKEESNEDVDNQGYNSKNVLSDELQLTINYPKMGYLYFSAFNIEKPMPVLRSLGYAAVINSVLKIEASTAEAPTSIDIHHLKFEAITIFTGKKTTLLDDSGGEGYSCSFHISTGLYKITVYAYDEYDNDLGSVSIKVLFIKSGLGREDFGVWIRTEYDNTVSTKKLNIGVAEFGRLLDKKEWQQCTVDMEKPDDTTVNFRFTREGIPVDDEDVDVFQTQFNVETTCDTTKCYSISLEIRFPFSILNQNSGGNPKSTGDAGESYFCARIGFSSPEGEEGAEEVDTRFYFGRDSIWDPMVLRMKITPDNAGGSDITFFGSLLTVDESGAEAFRRNITVDFEPAVELQITFIPRNARAIYEFGEGAGLKTKISFKTEGGLGLLDKLVYSVIFDPLPSYMSFDLNVFHGENLFEFQYECDRTYNIIFSLDSEQDEKFIKLEFNEIPRKINLSCDLTILGWPSAEGSLNIDTSDDIESCSLYLQGKDHSVKLELHDLPMSFTAKCGVDLGVIGDLSASGFFDFDLSGDIGEGKLTVIGNYFSFIANVTNFPYDLELDSFVDVQNGEGNIGFSWDSNNNPTVSASITYKEWTVTGGAELKNKNLELSWDIDSVQREGYIQVSRSWSLLGKYTTFFISIAHDDWIISDTFELKNTQTTVSWDLPTSSDRHVSLDLDPNGGRMFTNSISIVKDSTELLNLELGLKTEDNLHISWDYDQNGHIKNFEWSGKIIKAIDLYLMVDYEGADWAHFTIEGHWEPGESGSVSLTINKEVEFTILDIETEEMKICVSTTFNPDSTFEIAWDVWNDWKEGELDIYASSIAQAELEFGFGNIQNGEHKFGFYVKVTSEFSLDDTFWWDRTGTLPKCGWYNGGPNNKWSWEIWLLFYHLWIKLWPLLSE